MAGMLAAVRAALRGRVAADPRDKAAEKLALAYAGLIDAAAPAAKYRKALAALGRAVELSGDEDAPEALEVVRQALAEHSVASDLGPKLLASLTSLGLTVAARGGDQKGAGGKPSGQPKPTNPLDRIKQQREKRRAG